MLHWLDRLVGPQTNTNRRCRRTKKARLQLAVEALEDRSVPSTLQVVNGVLNYTGGAGIANHLTVSLSGTTYTFTDTAEKISALGIPGATGSGTNTVTLPAAQVPPAGMLINLGDLNDFLSIESTANAISVQGGDGNDLIDVGKFGGGTLGAVAAPVTVDGQAGTDTLRINDPTAGTPRIYTVTATGVTTTSRLAVSYAGTENLSVNAGLFPNTFNVLGTAALTRTTINGGPNGDTFNVGNTAKTLDDIQGLLTLNGASQGAFDQDVVNLLDQGSTVAHSYVVRDNSVARSGAATIIYSGMEGLTLNAGSAADGVTVVATAAATPVTLNMGDGNDVVNLATRTGSSLDLLLGQVTVNGEAGTDSILLNDQVDTDDNRYVVTATNVSRTSWADNSPFTILNYTNAENLTLNAGNFDDDVSVPSTSAATPLTLKMGDGIDHVSIDFGDLLGPVTVDGQGGSRDSLFLDDTNGAYGQTYTVNSTAVSRSGAAPVSYAAIEFLAVVGAQNVQSPSPRPNRFVVKSTSANTFTFLNQPSALSDEYVVGSDSKSLDGIQGALRLSTNGLDSLVLDDSGDLTGNSYTLTANSVARSGAAMISLLSLVSDPTGLASLTLNAGPANDAVTVQSLGANVLATLNLGAGNDTVTFRQGSPDFPDILSPVEVNGGAGADAILVDDSDVGSVVTPRTYTINTTGVGRDGRSLLDYNTVEGLDVNAGSGDDDVTVLGSQATLAVRAGLGDDVFHVGNAIPFVQGHVTLDGQGGANTLDYSASLFGVRVNLALGTATGADGGVSNIENVNGSQANDIIVGNDQDNVLQGGPGRDILIGRGGADTIYGGTPSSLTYGDGDDIVIGASTVYDLNASALEDIMREWGRTDLTGTPLTQYYTRINHLLGVSAGGLSGTTILDLSKTTDDGAADYLDGGTDLDWSFRFNGDTTLVNPGERVN
jgi:Ca2+-binding RTX toxin-like protein